MKHEFKNFQRPVDGGIGIVVCDRSLCVYAMAYVWIDGFVYTLKWVMRTETRLDKSIQANVNFVLMHTYKRQWHDMYVSVLRKLVYEIYAYVRMNFVRHAYVYLHDFDFRDRCLLTYQANKRNYQHNSNYTITSLMMDDNFCDVALDTSLIPVSIFPMSDFIVQCLRSPSVGITAKNCCNKNKALF